MNIVIVLPKLEDAKGMRSLLVRNGFRVDGVFTTGSQAIAAMDDLGGGVLLCSYKVADMVYSQILECMPTGFEMIMMASQRVISECYGNDVVCLTMPFKPDDLINTVHMIAEKQARQRRRARLQPKIRSEQDTQIIQQAKEMLMGRNHMTEDEAHKYLQKNSMDSGTGLVETARMVLTLLKV